MLVTLLGFPWAIAQWAPFSLLAEAIHSSPDPDYGEPDIDDNQSILLADTSTHLLSQQNDELFAVENEDSDGDDVVSTRDQVALQEREQEGSDSDDGDDDGTERDGARLGLMGNPNARRSWLDVSDLGENSVQNGGARSDRGSLSAKAGIILGIHNIFVVIPQFLVTGLTAFIFAILEPHKSVLHGDHPGKIQPGLNTTTSVANNTDSSIAALTARQEGELTAGPPTGLNSVAIIFRIGGIWAIIAFVLSWRLSKELRRRF